MAYRLSTRHFNASSSSVPPNGTDTTFNTTAIWGPITDYRPSRQPSIIAATTVAFLVSAVFVVLRFHTRRRLKIISPSDWVILPALLCSAGVTISAIEQALRGAGRHSWEIEFAALPALQRASWYGMLFYGMSLSFTRISILLLYRRIFTYNWAKRAIEVSLVVVSLLGIWFVISVCTACVPLQAFWRWELMFGPDGKMTATCLPYQIWWANAALHLTSDLVIIALPMPILSTLKLPRRQKYALVGVFALGFFVCLISILRLIALIDITFNPSMDGAYTSADLVYWTAAEVNAAIVCACAMTLKPLVQSIFPRLLGARSARYGGGGGRGGGQDNTSHSLPWITPVTASVGGEDGTGTTTTTDQRRSWASSHPGRRGSSSMRNSFRQSFTSWGISSSGGGGKTGSVRTSIHAGPWRGRDHGGHVRSGSGASGASSFVFSNGGTGTTGKKRKSSHHATSSGYGYGYDLPRVEEREFRGGQQKKGTEREFHYFGCEDLMYDYKSVAEMEHEHDADVRRRGSDTCTSVVSTESLTGVAAPAAAAVTSGRTTEDDDLDDGDSSLLNGRSGAAAVAVSERRRPGTAPGGGGGGEGHEWDSLAAPPRAHLRLSIHVTRSVHVTKTPSSPVPPGISTTAVAAAAITDGSDDEKGPDGPDIPPWGPPSSTFGEKMG